jgi:hypothetical protein
MHGGTDLPENTNMPERMKFTGRLTPPEGMKTPGITPFLLGDRIKTRSVLF